MEKNSKNKGVIKLWGHDFNRAKDGLDEEQVVSFVNKGEVTATIGAAPAEGKLMKIQITLSGKSVLDETKERLNREVSRILSS